MFQPFVTAVTLRPTRLYCSASSSPLAPLLPTIEFGLDGGGAHQRFGRGKLPQSELSPLYSSHKTSQMRTSYCMGTLLAARQR